MIGRRTSFTTADAILSFSPTAITDSNTNNNTNTNKKSSSSPSPSSSSISLSLYAKNLKNCAGLFQSLNTFAVVTLIDDDHLSKTTILGSTETYQSSLSPVWTKIFHLPYALGRRYDINVGVYHRPADSPHGPELIGSATFEIHSLVTSRGHLRAQRLSNRGGVIYARVGNTTVENEVTLSLTLQGHDLFSKTTKPKKRQEQKQQQRRADGSNSSDSGTRSIYFEMSRYDGYTPFTYNAKWLPVSSSESIVWNDYVDPNNIAYEWIPTRISVDRLCDGDFERSIKIAVYATTTTTSTSTATSGGGGAAMVCLGCVESNLNGLIKGGMEQKSLILETTRGGGGGRLVIVTARLQNNWEVAEESSRPQAINDAGDDGDESDEDYLDVTLHGRHLLELLTSYDDTTSSTPKVTALTPSVTHYEISHPNQLSQPKIIYRSSPTSTNSLNCDPSWPMASIKLSSLCPNGNFDTTIRIKVFSNNTTGFDSFLGSVETTVTYLLENNLLQLKSRRQRQRLQEGVMERIMEEEDDDADCLLPLHKETLADTTTPDSLTPGFIVIMSASLRENHTINEPYIPPTNSISPPSQPHSLLDYLSGGLTFQLCIAIDFNASNGTPLNTPSSLHHTPRKGLNSYEAAIISVMSILQHYNQKQFVFWGYGAHLAGIPLNCFQIGMSASVARLKELLHFYRTFLRIPNVQMNPIDDGSSIKEVIENAGKIATYERLRGRELRGNQRQKYTILVVLSDGGGLKADDEGLRMAFAKVSKAPLSVVLGRVGYKNDKRTRRSRKGPEKSQDGGGGGEVDDEKGREDGSGMIDDIEQCMRDMVKRHPRAERDIARFVDLRIDNDDGDGDFLENKKFPSSKAVEDALMDIPRQVVEFYSRGKGYELPKPPRNVNTNNMPIEDMKDDERHRHLDLELDFNVRDDQRQRPQRGPPPPPKLTERSLHEIQSRPERVLIKLEDGFGRRNVLKRVASSQSTLANHGNQSALGKIVAQFKSMCF